MFFNAVDKYTHFNLIAGCGDGKHPTWHGCTHLYPRHPAKQVQLPSTALQAPPFAQRHVALHPRPHFPRGQGIEQSTPCQPGGIKGNIICIAIGQAHIYVINKLSM